MGVGEGVDVTVGEGDGVGSSVGEGVPVGVGSADLMSDCSVSAAGGLATAVAAASTTGETAVGSV